MASTKHTVPRKYDLQRVIRNNKDRTKRTRNQRWLMEPNTNGVEQLDRIYRTTHLNITEGTERKSKAGAYLIQHPMQLISCLNNSIPVIAIHNKYKPLCVLDVMYPQWTDLYQREATLVKSKIILVYKQWTHQITKIHYCTKVRWDQI